MAILMLASPYLIAASDFTGSGSGCSCTADKSSVDQVDPKTSDGGGSGPQTPKSIFDAMPDVQLLAWTTSGTFLDSPSIEFLKLAYVAATKTEFPTAKDKVLLDIKDEIDSTSNILFGIELRIAEDMSDVKYARGIMILNFEESDPDSKLLQLLDIEDAKSAKTIEGVEMMKVSGVEICKPKPNDAICETPDILFGMLGNSMIMGHEELVSQFLAAFKSGSNGKMKPLMKDLANKWQLQTNASFGVIADLSKTLTYKKTVAIMDAILAKDGVEPSMGFLAAAIANGSSGASVELAAFLNTIDEADFSSKVSLTNKNFDLNKIIAMLSPPKAEDGIDNKAESETEPVALGFAPQEVSCYDSYRQMALSEQFEVVLDDVSAGTVTTHNIPLLMNYGVTEIARNKVRIVFGANPEMPVPVDQIIYITDLQTGHLYESIRIRIGLPPNDSPEPLDGKTLCAE